MNEPGGKLGEITRWACTIRRGPVLGQLGTKVCRRHSADGAKSGVAEPCTVSWESAGDVLKRDGG